MNELGSRSKSVIRAAGDNSRAVKYLGLLFGGFALAAAALSGSDVQAQAPASPDGAEVFTTAGCAACHGPNGEGGAGPQLAGDEALANTDMVINQVLHGGQMMPPIGEGLTDAQVAAVINFIRSSWGNTTEDTVTAEQVGAIRG
jgi:mono/diheme cytochrome c family protein